MLKVLLKKQLLGLFKGAFHRSAMGKKGKKGGIILYAVLFAYLAVVFVGMFFALMQVLCEPLHQAGLDWLYFVYGMILSTVLGVIGTVFMAQSQLYDAKDNEQLLSLPIPPGYILFCRMVPLFGQIFLFEALVLAPCFVVYGLEVGVSLLLVLCWCLLAVVIPLLGLTLSCLLGWLVALLTSRMRSKTVFSIVLSLGFLAAYYVIYFQFTKYLNELLANSAAIGASIRGYGYPLYLMGLAGQGDLPALGFTVLVCLLLFGILYWILSKTYLRILTAKHSAAKVRYRRKAMHLHSENSALLRKEWKRFTSSASYLLNCGLGVILLIAGTVALVLRGKVIIAPMTAAMPGLAASLPLAVTACIITICSMNLVAAPSVSLEGSGLWILQSLPVDPRKVMDAKLRMHFLVSAPVAAVCALVLSRVFSAGILMTVLMILVPVIFVLFFGCLGLMINLLKPRLDWDNETQVVKQSASVTVSLFLNWGIVAALIGCYFWFGKHWMPEIFLLVCGSLFLAGALIIRLWLMKKGSQIFAYL